MIPTAIVDSVLPTDISPASVSRAFAKLIEQGSKLTIAGKSPVSEKPLPRPHYQIDLFDTTFWLCDVRQMPELRFMPGYVMQRDKRGAAKIAARIFYKDNSLAWRVATHFAIDDGHLWIGKGDTRTVEEDGYELEYSDESTTDLPLEMQTAMEKLLGRTPKPKGDRSILKQFLRQSSTSRVAAFADFVKPRSQAAANPKNLIHSGKPVAWFRRAGDPTSLKIAKSFEPDFRGGVLETTTTVSSLYGGDLKRFRILSTNGKIQWLFIAGPQHVWIIPPQALTTELSTYGVRSVDVIADDDLFIPGYEYHYDEEGGDGEVESYSQIPDGFAGPASPLDDAKADASPWLNALPIIQQFRREVL